MLASTKSAHPSATAANYIDDVFSTYLYAGNGSTQTINNGLALANGFTFSIGDALGGGYVAGYVSSTGNGVATHVLIVAPKATGETNNIKWKLTNTNTPGTDSVIDGYANSEAMNDANHPAAQFCRGLTIGGFTDWYMPALNELEICYYNLKPASTSNNTSTGANAYAVPSRGTSYTASIPAQTSASLFAGGAQAFDAGSYYWPSTQQSSTNAWTKYFYNGALNFDSKNTSVSFYYVRAIRKIALTDAALDPYRITGKGGLVWQKNRTSVNNHILIDTVRGNDNAIFSNSVSSTSSGYSEVLTSFNTNGFSLSNTYNILNVSGQNYASWTFCEQPKFFDIVTGTADSSGNVSFNHSLGSVPGFVIIKSTTNSSDWYCYHRSLGDNYYIRLNLTNAAGTYSGFAYTPTDTTFSATIGFGAGAVGYVAYLFAHNAGGFGATGTDNVISCGSFTTDGSSNATVNLGYEPQWVLAKDSTTAGTDWILFDNMRGLSQTSTSALFPNKTNAESNYSGGYNPVNATGFSSLGFFTAGATIIYIAIRRPMKPPTTGTQVFSPVAFTGNNSGATGQFITSNFPIDLAIQMFRNQPYGDYLVDRLRGLTAPAATGNPDLNTNSTSPQNVAGNFFNGDSNVGIKNYGHSSSLTLVNWLFKRASNFFDVVCFTPTGVAHMEPHNLNAVPELIIGKGLDSTFNWYVYSAPLGNTKALYFNTDNSFITGTYLWNNTSPTSTAFSLGASGLNSSASSSVIAYLFATVAGVSKVGSYTGTGATLNIDAGFTTGARFVMIKRTDDVGNWFVWDTARGMVSGTDPRLALNLTDAESNANWVYTASSGFQIVTTDASVNASGGSYIYLAIA